MKIINISNFINKFITKRSKSFFESDILKYNSLLEKEIFNKSVLVIGGAGTIGSSFIKSILNFKPNKLIVVDINENGLTELTRDLRSTKNQFIPIEFKTYPMSFGDPVFKKMFLSSGPFHIVANFAAHKHVRSEKDQFSIEAMLDNNLFKAKDLLDLLNKNKPQHFFCVSTDKAANPVNVMGASKKLMEEVILSYSKKFKITTARFANVAFSNGSLLDGYLQRIFKQQPISCPIDVKRFFVSPEESGQICMLACILGKSGEIFFPKLSEDKMVFFKDITFEFFKELDKDYVICKDENEAKLKSINMKNSDPYPVFLFKSDTSGEKLFEEFYTQKDQIDLIKFDSLGVIKNVNKKSIKEINYLFNKLKNILFDNKASKNQIVNTIKEFIPNFEHFETGRNLDQKM